MSLGALEILLGMQVGRCTRTIFPCAKAPLGCNWALGPEKLGTLRATEASNPKFVLGIRGLQDLGICIYIYIYLFIYLRFPSSL